MDGKGASRPRLRIHLFGFPSVSWKDGRMFFLESIKVRALFYYLLMHPNQAQPRDVLTRLLWPDVPDERARKNLRQGLYNLRQAFGDLADVCLDVQRDTVTLREHPDLWVDAWIFQRLAEEVRRHVHRSYGACPYCATRYEGLVQLYRGDFLQGFTLQDAPSLEEWVEDQRRHYRKVMQDGAHFLLRYHYLRGDYAQVEHRARWWIQQEPWDDAGYAYLMRALAHQGRRGEAFRVYRQYAERMKELGVEVPPEARHLLYEIQEGLLPEPKSVQQGRRLPLPDASLIGRRQELDLLVSLLAHPETRVVTLTGPGGSGKTRLAQEVARKMLPLFPDGVFWIRLGPITSEQEFPRALQEALEHDFSPERWYREWLRWMEPKRALLIFDQAEEVVDLLAQHLPLLLTQAPHVAILLTSRRALQIPFEHCLPLRGLAYPDENEIVETLDEALAYPAVALFVERARKLAPFFTPEGDELQALIRILQLTYGLPLAIELAAAQAAHTSCQNVLQRLEASCLHLETIYRDQPDRHRSLLALMRSTWEHLPQGHRTAVMKLAIFRGPFDEVLAREVAGVSPSGLRALTAASLLIWEKHPWMGQIWVFHPFIREFARNQLQNHPSAYREVRQAARAWITQMLQSPPQDFGPERALWMQRLRALQEEVDGFLEELLKEGEPNDIGAALWGIYTWFLHQGMLRTGWQYFTMLEGRLAHPAFQKARAHPRILGRLLHRRAVFAFQLGEMQRAEEDIQRVLEVLEGEDQTQQDLGWALQILAQIRHTQGRLDEAEERERQALAQFRKHGDQIDQANALNNLGSIAFYRGDFETAGRYFEEALHHYREAKAWVFLANTLSNLSMIELTQNRYEKARRTCEEALRVAQRANAQIPLTFAWLNLGTIAIYLKEYLMAYRHLRRAEQIARRLGHVETLTSALINQGVALHHLGRYEEAKPKFEEAIALAQEGQIMHNVIQARQAYAHLLLDMGRMSSSLTLLIQAFQAAMQHEFTSLVWPILDTLARYLYAIGKEEEAHALLLWMKQQPLSEQATRLVDETQAALRFPPEPSKATQTLAARFSSLKDWLNLAQSLVPAASPREHESDRTRDRR